MFVVVLKMTEWVQKSIGYSSFFCFMVSGIAGVVILCFFEIFV